MAEFGGNGATALPLDLTETVPPEPMAAMMPVTPAVSPFPKRPKRRFTIDTETVVDSILRRAEQIEDELNAPEGWMERRVQRYAKYRGWLEDKTDPWVGCSNVDPGILPIAELRANAGLHNVTMTQRPLLRAKATNRAGADKEDRISELIDVQLLVEPGAELAERRLSDYIGGFLQDGNAVAFTPWVRDESVETHVTYRPGIASVAPSDYILELFLGREDPQSETGRTGGLFPSSSRIEQDATRDHVFHATYTDPRKREAVATVEVYTEDDGTLALVVTRPVTRYDGPVMLPLAIGDILVPTRCTNLQPPFPWNPDGAPYLFLKRRLRIDEIRRLKETGEFNELDDKGLESIIATARSGSGVASSAKPAEELERQKDAIEGRTHAEPDATFDDDVGHLEVEFFIAFDRWDVDGDGLAEDVYFALAREAKVLCEGRLLTERWPATTPYRPLAEAACIPVPGRWYAISLLELGEALADLIKATFDQSFDAWTISNMPSGFYGASSKMSADVIQWRPGEFYPIPGNPRETLYIPQWPQHDQTGALGIINLAFGFFERKMAMGALQSGQVPTGKASALRTFGATYAILQQGDVRADQLLIRFFNGLAQVARNFHRMNRHLLPEGKEFRVLGWDGAEAEGYRRIESVIEIDADIDFEFRPDFLLTNPAVLSQALQSVLGVLGTPLAFQLGVTDAKLFYRAVRDYVRSLRLDAKLYLKPPTEEGLPAILASEAIGMISQSQPVRGVPLEGAEVHLKTLFEFMQSDEFGHLTEAQAGLFRVWVEDVAQRAQQERMVAAAQAFQGALQSGNAGLGTVPTSGREPEVGTGTMAPEAAATTGAEGGA